MEGMESKLDRAAGIVIRKDKILLIHRFKEGKEYYVFPGGGIETKESPKQAVERELEEETSVKVKVEKLLFKIKLDITTQYYFLCKYISGTAKLGADSIEKSRMQKDKTNFYEPMWFELKGIGKITLYPLEIRDRIVKSFNNNLIDRRG